MCRKQRPYRFLLAAVALLLAAGGIVWRRTSLPQLMVVEVGSHEYTFDWLDATHIAFWDWDKKHQFKIIARMDSNRPELATCPPTDYVSTPNRYLPPRANRPWDNGKSAVWLPGCRKWLCWETGAPSGPHFVSSERPSPLIAGELDIPGEMIGCTWSDDVVYSVDQSLAQDHVLLCVWNLEKRQSRTLGTVRFPVGSELVASAVSPDGQQIAWLVLHDGDPSILGRWGWSRHLHKMVSGSRALLPDCSLAVWVTSREGKDMEFLGATATPWYTLLLMYSGSDGEMEENRDTYNLRWSSDSKQFAYYNDGKLHIWRLAPSH